MHITVFILLLCNCDYFLVQPLAARMRKCVLWNKGQAYMLLLFYMVTFMEGDC